ncbi:hypothetical protein [Paenibacillus sp. S28]|uniref:hypothetical protein n=1 Tax=Paenibacillus sp. S28 TaxID=2767463 RepID=UPI00190B038A|nr:hypothetical protein [Paenibacillus sp. S28]MBJ9992469.1 hypothetical protein [Paenibacillus sp. S28]
MTRQRIKFTIITGIVIMGIVFLLGIFYSENIPSGILLRAGITKNNVAISADSFSFRHYFITDKGEPAGIMTLQRNGKLWSKYYYSKDVSISKSSPNISLLKSFQPIYKDYTGKVIPVWGGSVSDYKDEYQSVKFSIDGNIKEPTSSIRKGGKIYFFYIDPDLSMDESIEVLPQ